MLLSVRELFQSDPNSLPFSSIGLQVSVGDTLLTSKTC